MIITVFQVYVYMDGVYMVNRMQITKLKLILILREKSVITLFRKPHELIDINDKRYFLFYFHFIHSTLQNENKQVYWVLRFSQCGMHPMTSENKILYYFFPYSERIYMYIVCIPHHQYGACILNARCITVAMNIAPYMENIFIILGIKWKHIQMVKMNVFDRDEYRDLWVSGSV